MPFRIQRTNEPVDFGAYMDARESTEINSDSIGAKRVFDFVLALAGLVFFAPIIALFAILIWLKDGHPPIFGHKRLGKNGREFHCYKLRSMVPDAKQQLEYILATDKAAAKEWEETQKLVNDPRITSIGKFLRASSIDELPQLWNIVRGDMSIVGPRPIVQNEVQKYGEWYDYYSSVRPGLTGLWQVKGRSDTTYEQRVVLDVEYVRNQSFFKDVSIIILTIPAILNSRGAV
ncbi:MAG: sugar transferase [Pseudomonadota bacterium]